MKVEIAESRKGSGKASKARKAGRVSPLHRVDDDAHLGQFIPLHYHGQMLADDQRMSSFREAIEKLVPEGSHVVDLGGGTGALSYFASKRARKVTCVERIPHVAAAARRLLAANGAYNVTVVDADARLFVPDEPVDVVLCEMLHVALVREKQVEVIESFKRMHEAKFGIPVGRIIPEASLLAVQPIHEPFEFHGFYAPVTRFYPPGAVDAPTIEMGAPEIYATIEYLQPGIFEFSVDGTLTCTRDGYVNALRFITKNLIGIFPEEGRSADWHMQYMSIPLPHPIQMRAGEELAISFQYTQGASIESLIASLKAEKAR